LSDEQKSAIDEAEEQIKTGQFLTSEQADKQKDTPFNPVNQDFAIENGL